MSPLEARFQEFLRGLDASHSLRSLRPGAPRGARWIERDGRTLLNFSANDYLGLATHPELVRRACEWTERWGSGSGASRLMTGTFEIHEAVERKLARAKKTEAALLFNSGYQANVSVLPALLDERFLGARPLVFADLRIHASLHHGLRSAGVKPVFFRPNDPGDLEARLERQASRPGPRFILTESVFSMDGRRADVASLARIASDWDAFLYLDEAHATGVLGRDGMGLSGDVADGGVHLAFGTFSKAMGGFGAYVAGTAAMREYLVNRCRGFIFTTALPPGVLGAIDAALDLVPGLGEERAHLARLADRLRGGLRHEGFDTAGSDTQIVPAIVGGKSETLELSARLEAAGVLGVAIRPPSVPPGTSRIRFSVTATHESSDVDRVLEVLSIAGVRS